MKITVRALKRAMDTLPSYMDVIHQHFSKDKILHSHIVTDQDDEGNVTIYKLHFQFDVWLDWILVEIEEIGK